MFSFLYLFDVFHNYTLYNFLFRFTENGTVNRKPLEYTRYNVSHNYLVCQQESF